MIYFKRLIMLAVAVLLSTNAIAADTKWEYTQKAKIIKYILNTLNWPDNALPKDNIHVCVLGTVPYMKAIDDMNGVMIKDRKIVVEKTSFNKKENEHCQLIYLTKSEEKKANELIQAFSEQPILLLADMDDFAENGGSMNFVIQKNAVMALTMNLESMKKANLTMNISNFNQLTVIPEKKDLTW